MAKVNAALREKLMGQREGMKTGGLVIKRKEWSKGKIRLLPMTDELPGPEFIGFFCQNLKKGSTSPATFGVPCPLLDYLDNLKATGSKEDKDFAWNFVNTNREYWIACIVRGEEQTVTNPNLHAFPITTGPYSKILDWITDEDIGEDITHAEEGRDLLLKKIVKDRTEWSIDKLDRSPIHDDADVAEAIVEAAQNFDPRNLFWSVDWEALEEIYSGLTGEEIPASYADAWKEYEDAAKSKPSKSGKGKTTSKPAAKPEPEDEPEETEGEEEEEPAASDDHPLIGKRVKWEDEDDGAKEGVVTGIDTDEGYEGNLLIEVEGEDDPWSMPEDGIEEVPEETPAVKKSGGKKKPGKKASGGIKGKMGK